MAGKKLSPWQQELTDFTRAFSGAFLFGIPLLFTMEMWWIGTYADFWKLAAFFTLTFLFTIGTNFAVGFKKKSTFNSVLIQAVNTVAVGIVAATVVLLFLNRIVLDEPLSSTLGKILIQAVPLSIGASLGNSLLGQSGKSREGGQKSTGEPDWKTTAKNIAASMVGGIFIGFTIAPTMEVPKLAAELSYWHELSIIVFSLLLSYMIVYESGFDPQKNRGGGHGYFKHPFTESLVAYMVSLSVAFGALFLFDRIELTDPVTFMVSQVLVLGVPTVVGASAGRIVV